ncbi:MAG: hypothetical protein WCO35_00615 [Candidatus Nomurabacteria bacterium]
MKYRYIVPVVLLSSLFLREERIFLFIILIFTSFMLLYKKRKEYIYLYFFGFFMGSLIEYIFITFGAWTYNLQDIFYLNFGFYLPFLWGITALCFIEFYKKITN